VSPSEQALHSLETITDFVRWGASRFAAAGLHFGHGTDNAVDEALVLVRHALHLGHDLPREFYAARLTDSEKRAVLELIERRIVERVPAPYLTARPGSPGCRSSSTARADSALAVRRADRGRLRAVAGAGRVERVLDLCTGSGCIAIACALAFPAAEWMPSSCRPRRWKWRAATSSATASGPGRACWRATCGRRWRARLRPDRQQSALRERREMAALPPEYAHEPELGLRSGAEGLDVVARILAGARATCGPAACWWSRSAAPPRRSRRLAGAAVHLAGVRARRRRRVPADAEELS
jgi:ribosomal protein L3 glutamine methyltransferase